MSIDEIKSDIYKKLGFEIKSDNIKNEIQRCVVDSTHPFLILQWATRCFSKGHRIFLRDGSIKTVEDIVIGDILIGHDNTPRTVISTHTGIGKMYKITPNKGDSFSVNEDHILYLERTNVEQRRDKCYPKTVEISIKDYFKKNTHFKHLYKLVRSPEIKFDYEFELEEPYFLGLWLGDGNTANVGITTCDKEIVDYIYWIANKYKLNVKIYGGDSYIISRGNEQKRENKLSTLLTKYKMLDHKIIPDIFHKADKKSKLLLLAGLLDSDGSFSGKGYEITQKNKNIADGIVQLCRSLGFTTSIKYRLATCKQCKDDSYPVWRIHIYGKGINEIPCILPRKKANVVGRVNNLRCGFKIEEVGIDNYYGFTLKENPLFVDCGGFIQHNCGKSRPSLNLCSTGKSLCFTPIGLLHNNHRKEAVKANIDISQLEFACYASSHKFIDGEYDCLWLDECHAVTENNISNLAQIKAKRIICTSATIPPEKMKLLYSLGKPKIYTITTLMGIQWGLISKPEIFVIDKPLSPFVNHIYEKGKDKNKKNVTCTFNEYQKTYKWMKSAQRPNLKISCNEIEYYTLLGEEFDKLTWAYKQKDANRGRVEMQRKLLGNTRKKWLNFIKTLYAIELCKKLRRKGQRFIVFTNDINQCGLIAQGKTQIHSDNPSKDDEQSIEDFNNKIINELYAVSKMDAGLTLYDFDAAIHVSLSGSTIQSTQRTGRSLASDFPIVYVIRVPNTKDAEFFDGLKNELPQDCFHNITIDKI